VILFLDFDGVLHPEGEDHILNGGADFCFLPRLEALLREFPHVNIVISSSWREQLLYETLLKPFSSDIRDRILGATPPSGLGLPPPDESAEPDAWRHKQRRKLQAVDTLRIHQAQPDKLETRYRKPPPGAHGIGAMNHGDASVDVLHSFPSFSSNNAE